VAALKVDQVTSAPQRGAVKTSFDKHDVGYLESFVANWRNKVAIFWW